MPATVSASPRPAASRRALRPDGTTALLRLEGLVSLGAAVAAYHALDGGWGWFAALFLVPDLSMLGYFAGPRAGATSYNAGHSYLGPAVVAALGFVTGWQPALLGALIWIAHIGFDRMLGYGLERPSGFRDTHLGRVGRAER
jgi:hypothetical protein